MYFWNYFNIALPQTVWSMEKCTLHETFWTSDYRILSDTYVCSVFIKLKPRSCTEFHCFLMFYILLNFATKGLRTHIFVSVRCRVQISLRRPAILTDGLVIFFARDIHLDFITLQQFGVIYKLWSLSFQPPGSSSSREERIELAFYIQNI